MLIRSHDNGSARTFLALAMILGSLTLALIV